MTYNETLDYLYTQLPMFQRQGPPAFKKDLGNTIRLCAALGDPQHSFKSIHIAGTNGKGTCSHILSSVLQQPGKRIGLYTSPHYKDFRERIKINGQLMPKKEVVQFVADYRGIFEEIQPSFFEITVAMAFWYFAKEGVDWAIVETGLGGRLDSTNILRPELCLITNISLDHQAMLGNDLPTIAKEKAGIIKKGIPVIIGEHQKEVHAVFTSKAKKEKTKLFLANKICGIKNYKSSLKGAQFDLTSGQKKLGIFKTDLIGNYQEKNLRSALATFFHLSKNHGIAWEETWIKKALRNIRSRSYYVGRWQSLPNQGATVLCDSAHNIAGISSFVAALDNWRYDNLHIIFGTVSDKDPTPILSLLPKAARYYFAKANIPRGMPSEQLTELAAGIGLDGQDYSSVRRAMAAAKRRAGKKDLIVACGSIFVVGELL